MTRLIRQHGECDCGVAAVAMLAGWTHEDTYCEVARIDHRQRGKGGLLNRELVALAARLGVRLLPSRTYDLDHDDGILRVRWNDPRRHRGGHFVAVRDGLVLCPTRPTKAPWREYLIREQGRPCTLLREAS